MATVTEINRINIFDTIFSDIALYDPEIINIKVYGILDENKKLRRYTEVYHLITDCKYFFVNNNKHHHYNLLNRNHQDNNLVLVLYYVVHSTIHSMWF